MPALSLRRARAAPADPQLSRALLRRSMGEHETQRHRCLHCRRTPLTGEVVHVYETASGERLVCALCRPLRRKEPARSELMHAPEHERSVRLAHRRA
ncbi:MAG TPA: hypothetical protein VEY49_03205 [Solirubrobacteraceae bacterium]|jgi:hypothetical protein|nr:hypothetical protein [Solirubrobacteraceae bacterium]